MPRNIVIGQKVKPVKVEQAKALRRRMTPAEAVLWQALRGNRLSGFHFRRQQVISGFIVDFYCHAAALAIEVDGEIHQQQFEADQARDMAIAKHGIRVVRFSNVAVRACLPDVLRQIEQLCAERQEQG